MSHHDDLMAVALVASTGTAYGTAEVHSNPGAVSLGWATRTSLSVSALTWPRTAPESWRRRFTPTPTRQRRCRRGAEHERHRKTWTDKDHDEATAKADRISMRAYGLAQVLKVCAFAAEARRTLTDIEDALVYRDKARGTCATIFTP